MAERCVCCGESIPEGRQVCPNCENAPLREKMVELMAKADEHREEICVGHGCGRCAYEPYDECGIQIKAEYLIAHGVRLEEKQATSQATSDESKRFAEGINVLTNADHLREAISTEDGLAKFLMRVHDEGIYIPFCQNKEECLELIEENGVPDEKCMECLKEWLRKPYEGDCV